MGIHNQCFEQKARKRAHFYNEIFNFTATEKSLYCTGMIILLFYSIPGNIKTRKKAPQPVGDYPFEFTVVDRCGDYDKMIFTVRVIKDVSIITLFEPRHENTNILHMRKQRRR